MPSVFICPVCNNQSGGCAFCAPQMGQHYRQQNLLHQVQMFLQEKGVKDVSIDLMHLLADAMDYATRQKNRSGTQEAGLDLDKSSRFHLIEWKEDEDGDDRTGSD